VGPGLGGWSLLGGCVLGRRLLGRRLAGALADLGDGSADLGGHALLDQDLQDAVGLSLQIEGGFVGFDLGQHLAGLHLFAALLLPLDDGALLHRVGELRHIYVWHLPFSGRRAAALARPQAGSALPTPR